MIVDCGVYEGGRRCEEPVDLHGALAMAEANGGFVWVGLHEPSEAEFEDVAKAFGLHPLAVEDAIVNVQQRPKLERYGDSLLMVIKPARYVDHDEVVDVGQIMVFMGERFLVTVRHGDTSGLAELRHELEADPSRLEWGSTSALHALADKVVDDYAEVLRGVEDDIDQIEHDVFSGPKASHAERIFKLKREVLDFRRAVDPLGTPLEELSGGQAPLDPLAADYFRDVHDHLLRVSEQLEGFDQLLDSALNANVAQVAMRQNQDMRKISAWVAIIALPTMIAGVYGMNFDHMPELGWELGYPFALGLMAVACSTLYVMFKRRDWL